MSQPVSITGRLTRDPELRYTNGGKAVAQFSVVTSRRFNDNGTWVDKDVSYWDCTAFDIMAENICEALSKGSAVIVVGDMRQENWEKDGQKKTAWRVLVRGVGPDLRWHRLESPPARSSKNSSSFDEDPPF